MQEEVEERKAVEEEEADKEKGWRKARLIDLKWSQIAVWNCEHYANHHHSARRCTLLNAIQVRINAPVLGFYFFTTWLVVIHPLLISHAKH